MDGSMTTVEIDDSVKKFSRKNLTINSASFFDVEETDLNFWIAKSEAFAREFLKVKVDLCNIFAIPKIIPWKSVIPIFDPGLDNSGMVKVLENMGFEINQKPNLMDYSSSGKTRQQSLILINNSRFPDEETMGKSPRWLRRWFKDYDSLLSLRGYGLAFALHYHVTEKMFDSRTFTLFPEDCLPGGLVARAEFFPSNNGKAIDFYPRDADIGCPEGGVRLAVSVPLR